MCFAYFSFKIYFRLFGRTPARILYFRHPCSSTFTCFEIQEHHIIPKVNSLLLRKSVIGDNLANAEAEKLLENSV